MHQHTSSQILSYNASTDQKKLNIPVTLGLCTYYVNTSFVDLLATSSIHSTFIAKLCMALGIYVTEYHQAR